MQTTINATSIGRVACHLQIGVQRIEQLARRLRLKPVLILDHVPHFDDDQIEIIREAICHTKKSG